MYVVSYFINEKAEFSDNMPLNKAKDEMKKIKKMGGTNMIILPAQIFKNNV